MTTNELVVRIEVHSAAGWQGLYMTQSRCTTTQYSYMGRTPSRGGRGPLAEDSANETRYPGVAYWPPNWDRPLSFTTPPFSATLQATYGLVVPSSVMISLQTLAFSASSSTLVKSF